MPSSDSKYAPTAWAASLYDDVTMPSGQLCQMRKPGIQRLIENGVLESADTLSTLVNQKHVQRVKGKGPAINPASLMKDAQSLINVMELVDKITAHMVVTPKVERAVVPDGDKVDDNGKPKMRALQDDERKPGVVYTDMIDMADRMFIFQYALGGTADLERFRSGLDEAMGSMASGESVPLSPQ